MNDLVYRWTIPQLNDGGYDLLKSTIKSGQWSYGPIARQVEHELEKQVQVKHALLTNSGTSALWLLLSLAKENKKQAVIIPAFGYSAAANVAAALGYEIYVADSCSDSPVVDPESVNRLLDDKVEYVIGINYFGYSVSWDEIPRNGTYKIIEDAAGSFGAAYKDKPSGSYGDFAIMSFHTSKAASAGGEGGCVLSNDKDFILRAKAAGRSGHIKGYYYSEMRGMNMLMTDIAACFLKDSLHNFNKMNEKRSKVVKTLASELNKMKIEVPSFNLSSNGRTQNYQTCAILVKDRDLVVELLRLNGIESRPCWPFLINEQPATNFAVKKTDRELQNAKRFAQEIVNIPIHPDVTSRQIRRLVSVLAKLTEMELLKG